MGRENSTLDWDKDIYGRGRQLNKWPFTDVVSRFSREISEWESESAPKVLEVGCGAGNNLWALSDLGFDAYGIDISPTVISFARERFSSQGLPVKLEVGSMSELPYEKNYFDFVLDRAAVTQVPLDEVSGCVSELARVLKPQGKLFCYTLFGENHSHRSYGQLQSNGSYDFFTDGIFTKVGMTSFFSQQSISELFQPFECLEIIRRLAIHGNDEVFEEYDLIATPR